MEPVQRGLSSRRSYHSTCIDWWRMVRATASFRSDLSIREVVGITFLALESAPQTRECHLRVAVLEQGYTFLEVSDGIIFRRVYHVFVHLNLPADAKKFVLRMPTLKNFFIGSLLALRAGPLSCRSIGSSTVDNFPAELERGELFFHDQQVKRWCRWNRKINLTYKLSDSLLSAQSGNIPLPPTQTGGFSEFANYWNPFGYARHSPESRTTKTRKFGM